MLIMILAEEVERIGSPVLGIIIPGFVLVVSFLLQTSVIPRILFILAYNMTNRLYYKILICLYLSVDRCRRG